MVRKLTSLPVTITLAISVPLLAVLMGSVLRLSVGVVVAVIASLVVLLIVVTVTRGRRASAWLRGKVPREYRNAPTAWALITEAEGTPERINNQQVMCFRMRVYAPEGQFDSLMYALLPVYPVNQFQTGGHYPVRYLPNDHSEVVYDTTPAAQQLGARPGWGTLTEPSVLSDDRPRAAGYTNYLDPAGLPSHLRPEFEAIMQEMFADRAQGKAVVKAQRATGQQRGMLAEIQLDLAITPQTGAPFDTTVTKWIPSSLTGRLQPGVVVEVSYAPHSPSDVSIMLTTATTTSTELLG